MNSYEYTYISSDDKTLFEQMISRMMASAWECQGGICVVYIPLADGFGRFTYFQAMTRELDPNGYTVKR